MQLFKSCLLAQGFQEIHTPKIIAGSSEGGSAVFKYVGTITRSFQIVLGMHSIASLPLCGTTM